MKCTTNIKDLPDVNCDNLPPLETVEVEDTLSCCGDVLDPDIMICPTCLEHN